MPDIWQQQLTLTQAILFSPSFPSPSVCHCTCPDTTQVFSAVCVGSKIFLCSTRHTVLCSFRQKKGRLLYTSIRRWKCIMRDMLAMGPGSCLRDVRRNMQSPQTSRIVCEVLLIRCSPIHALDCKGRKTPSKKVFLHLFKFISIKDQNHPKLPTGQEKKHSSYLKTEYGQSKGIQCSGWDSILQHGSRLAYHNQTPFTVMHVSLSSLAGRSLLLPQPTCACARISTGNGSDDASRRSRLVVWSWGGGGGGRGKRKKKDLPIAYDFQFAKQ